MKRIVLVVVAALGLATGYAGNNGENASDGACRVSAYDMGMDVGRLARYLGLTPEQSAIVEGIHSEFRSDMLNAAGLEGSERAFLVRNAVRHDLSQMCCVLTQEQYKAYLRVLNETFRNRGIGVW